MAVQFLAVRADCRRRPKGLGCVMKILQAPFSTPNLVRIAALLAGIVLMKAIGFYFGFSWLSALAAVQ